MFNQLSKRLVGTAALLWAIICAAQSYAEPPPAEQCSPAAMAAQQGPTALSKGPPSAGTPAKTAGVDPIPEAQKKAVTDPVTELKLGNVFFDAWEWNAAIEKYQKAAESPDRGVAGAARERLANALARRNAEPLGLRQWLPHPIDRWWLLDYTIPFLLLLPFLPLILKLMGWLSRILLGIMKPRKSSANWRVLLSGSAEEKERSLVFDELIITLVRLKIFRRNFAGGEIAVLSIGERSFFYPISLGALVEPGITVRGVDIGRVAAFFQALMEHYSYRLEIRVDSHSGSAYAFASLRWGAYTERVWQVPAMGSSTVFDFREIGRQLAYGIFGSEMVRQ